MVRNLICVLIGMSVTVASAQYVSETNLREQAEADRYTKLIAALNAVRGKEFWYLPNPKAIKRVKFIDSDESGDLPSRFAQKNFFITKETSFIVTHYSRGAYAQGDYGNYYLKLEFPDGKIGYLV